MSGAAKPHGSFLIVGADAVHTACHPHCKHRKGQAPEPGNLQCSDIRLIACETLETLIHHNVGGMPWKELVRMLLELHIVSCINVI